jgi:hypothetical protein
MNQTLSLYRLETIPLPEPDSETHALDLDLNDWGLELDVDLAASRELGEPVLKRARLGSLV